LTLSRKGLAKPLTIKRSRSVQKEISHHFFNDSYCYIKLNSFSKVSDDRAVREILSSRPKLDGLIIDLRGNPGGLMNIAIQMADLFMNHGNIVKVESARKTEYNANRSSLNIDYAIIILVDGESAGASEIFAAALQYHKKALILGSRTQGKTLIQSFLPFPDGSAMKYTTGKFLVASDKDIRGKGITPDIELSNSISESDTLLDLAKKLLMTTEGINNGYLQLMMKRYESMKLINKPKSGSHLSPQPQI